MSTVLQQHSPDEVVCNLRLLAANDVYTFRDIGGIGGYSTLKSLVNQHRTKHSLFVINGDVLGGSQLAEVFKGESVVAVLNAVQPDLVAVGNHEFDYGVDRLEELFEKSKFEWLSSNIRRKSRDYQLLKHVRPYKVYDYFVCSQTGDVLGRQEVRIPMLDEELARPVVGSSEASPYESPTCLSPNVPPSYIPAQIAEQMLQAREGTVSNSNSERENVQSTTPKIVTVRLGLVGACTVTSPFCSYPGPDVVFEEAPDVLDYISKRLRAFGCQIIVGLTHLTMAEDVKVANVCGSRIPVILGGHEHTPIVHQSDETVIFKTGQNANWLGIVDLSIVLKPSAAVNVAATSQQHASEAELSEPESKATSPTGAIAPFAHVLATVPSFALKTNMRQTPDPATESVIAEYEAKLREEEAKGPDVTRVLVTLVDGPLDTRTSTCRVRHASGAHLVADAMYAFMGPELADFAIINGGFVRGDKVYPEGSEITLKDIMLEFPFPKRAVVVTIKGMDLKEAIEQQLSNHPKPFGAFPHLSHGCHIIFDTQQSPGQRIQKFLVHGQNLDPNKDYRVVLTEFEAGGGDGCTAFLRGKPCVLPKDKTDCLISRLVVEYLDSQTDKRYSPANGEDRVVELGRK